MPKEKENVEKLIFKLKDFGVISKFYLKIVLVY